MLGGGGYFGMIASRTWATDAGGAWACGASVPRVPDGCRAAPGPRGTRPGSGAAEFVDAPGEFGGVVSGRDPELLCPGDLIGQDHPTEGGGVARDPPGALKELADRRGWRLQERLDLSQFAGGLVEGMKVPDAGE